MKKTTKILLLVVCVATLLVGAVAGTYAWLVASTAPVENTFTFGNIDITLTETKGTNTDGGVGQQYEFKILPGKTVPKDPTVTVLKGSEKCYLFVEITKENGFDNYIEYTIADGWEQLDAVNHPGVYYRTVNSDDVNDQKFPILEEDQVVVKSTVTKAQIDKMVEEGTLPSMSFVAYAVQFEGFETTGAAAAWNVAKPNP